jgi:hypothetical protein
MSEGRRSGIRISFELLTPASSATQGAGAPHRPRGPVSSRKYLPAQTHPAHPVQLSLSWQRRDSAELDEQRDALR